MSVGSRVLGRISMRGRMMILITSAMLPLGLFLAVSIASDYDRTMEDARREVMQSASLAAARQSQIFATSQILLDTVRRSSDVTVQGGAACEGRLAGVKDANPQFLSVMVTDPEGMITCHTSLRVRQLFTDVSLVERVMAPGSPEFVVGNFFIGKVTRRPTIPVAMPIRDDAGRKIGVVIASLNLDRLSITAESVSMAGRRSIAMIQPSSGRVLTHYPRATFASGTVFADHPLIQAMRRSPAGGVTEGVGFMGLDRVFGFAPIEGAETSGIMLAVGESTELLLSPVRRVAMWQIAAGIGVFLFAIGAVWWLGERLQLRPIARLTHIAARIGAGDFEARARLEPWQSPELRTLGATLDRMAARMAAGREAEQAVAASEAQYRLLAENTADLVTCVDSAGTRTFASPSSFEMVGYRPEELIGRRPSDSIHPEDMAQVKEMVGALRAGQPVTGAQYRMQHRDGRYIWVEVNGRPTEEGHVVYAIRDISERKRMEDDLAKANRQLAALASTDGLTGLLNRRSFDVFLAEAHALSLTAGSELSLLMIDVDRFKGFNDRYGHMAGDDCLRQVAVALRSILRRPGIAVARYGGEEFAVILPDTPMSLALQEAEALRFAMHRMNIRNEASEHGIVTISIGVASLSGAHDAQDALDLVRKADRALYAAKTGGRNRTEIGIMQMAEVS